MRTLILLALIHGLTWTACFGNPLAIDPNHRPCEMLAEQVVIHVGDHSSVVKGRYRFRQKEDHRFVEKAKHVTVYVPVLLPHSTNAEAESPTLQVGARQVSVYIRNDIATGDEPKSVELPKGWRMHSHEYNIPLACIGREFEISVEYIQPHSSKRRVGYVPILPPTDTKTARITFIGIEGRKLKKPSLLSIFHKGNDSISFVPKDRELITVASSR